MDTSFWQVILSFLQFASHNSTSNEIANVYVPNDPLIFAHVIYRHGDRNIMKPYANDPYRNEDKWPGGFHALSNIGKQQQYELGKFLRRRYSSLINSTYSPNDVYIRSTDMDRALMSAQCNVAGLFPPSKEEIWNENFNWQPIPIHTIPFEDDIFLNALTACPRWWYLYESYMNSSAITSIYEEQKPFIKFVEKNSGEPIKELRDLINIFDTLSCESLRGLTLPTWAKNALLTNILQSTAVTIFKSFTRTTEMKKIRAGFLMKEILDRFKNKTLSRLQPNRSLWIYSAHDLVMVNILNALDVFDMDIPPYASSIHFEMYRGDVGYYVQLFYRKTNIENLTPLNIPFCGTKCPLDRFYSLYQKILPTESEDYNTLCKNK